MVPIQLTGIQDTDSAFSSWRTLHWGFVGGTVSEIVYFNCWGVNTLNWREETRRFLRVGVSISVISVSADVFRALKPGILADWPKMAGGESVQKISVSQPVMRPSKFP
jgi:hypothetical protein